MPRDSCLTCHLPIVGFINKFILNKEFNLEKCGQPPLISEGGHPFLVREAASPQRVEAGLLLILFF
jgi:hypothetical protein